ncbi:MAG: nucleoside recognition protein [Clostridiales bacterium]|jgi:spore maturation protein A|nr:nucleoside recognition protein [Clostridiales bacterium]
MLNYIWGIMILLAVVVASFTGKMPDITNSALESAQDAVALCVKMTGIVAMWTGLMKIAEKAGLVEALSKKLSPVMKFLFPDLHSGSKAAKHISTNFIANILGIGWAATPAGLKAMEELQKTNPDKTTASRNMCMFLIINMSSLQIVSVNIVAYRAQYNSVNPSEIIGPGLVTTLVSTLTAVIAAKIFEKVRFK